MLTVSRVRAPEGVTISGTPRCATAALTSGCDGYAAGSTGTVTGFKQGCMIFVPDCPENVARWARRRTSLLVPVGFLAIHR